MEQVIGLFSSEAEARAAAKALQEAELGPSDIRVIKTWYDELETQFEFLPVSRPTSTISGAVGPRGRVDTSAELGGQGAEFFKRSLERGGALVLVQLSDDSYWERAESILDLQEAVAVAVRAS